MKHPFALAIVLVLVSCNAFAGGKPASSVASPIPAPEQHSTLVIAQGAIRTEGYVYEPKAGECTFGFIEPVTAEDAFTKTKDGLVLPAKAKLDGPYWDVVGDVTMLFFRVPGSGAAKKRAEKSAIDDGFDFEINCYGLPQPADGYDAKLARKALNGVISIGAGAEQVNQDD